MPKVYVDLNNLKQWSAITITDGYHVYEKFLRYYRDEVEWLCLYVKQKNKKFTVLIRNDKEQCYERVEIVLQHLWDISCFDMWILDRNHYDWEQVPFKPTLLYSPEQLLAMEMENDFEEDRIAASEEELERIAEKISQAENDFERNYYMLSYEQEKALLEGYRGSQKMRLEKLAMLQQLGKEYKGKDMRQ